jgi:4-hydroxybenzoate polyprenyltransferase
MATSGLGALLWLGAFPPVKVIGLGIITAFAGYTAVYAMNDVVDYRVDKEKIRTLGLKESESDLDAVFVRHPMAQGLLTFREGLLWTGAWALVALIGAYLLNPVCALIFLIGGLLEALYCLLLKRSYLRTFVSGAVKTSGGIAAVFAVAPHPSPLFLIILFLWLFFWEIGGQNVPNDWMDIEEDVRLDASTIPVRFGPDGAIKIIVFSLALAVALCIGLWWVTPARLDVLYVVGACVSGLFLLLMPAYRLYRTKAREQAPHLFNRASYYPLAMLIVVIFSMMI